MAPRPRKDEIIEKCRYLPVRMPKRYPYVKIKWDLTHTPHVKLTRLSERVLRERYNIREMNYSLPCLDSSKLKQESKEQDDIIPRASTSTNNPNLKVQAPMHPHLRSEDFLSWLDAYDAEMQMCLLSLLCKRHNRFAKLVVRYEANIDYEKLTILAAYLRFLPLKDQLTSLKAVLDRAVTSSGTTMGKISLLVTFLITDALRKPSSLQEHCPSFLELVIEHDLDKYLQGHLFREPKPHLHCILIAELHLCLRGIESAVEYIMSHSYIQLLLKRGPLQDLAVYGRFLCTIFQQIYDSKKWRFSISLTQFNVQSRIIPPDERIWASLALATLLRGRKVRAKEILKLIKIIIAARIPIPNTFFRAALVKLKKAECSEAAKLFKISPPYSISRTFMSKASDPIITRICLDVTSFWTSEEMAQAIEWLMRKLKKRHASTKFIELTIKIQDQSEETLEVSELQAVEANLKCKYLEILDSEPITRVCCSLSKMKPPLYTNDISGNHVKINSSALKKHLKKRNR